MYVWATVQTHLCCSLWAKPQVEQLQARKRLKVPEEVALIVFSLSGAYCSACGNNVLPGERTHQTTNGNDANCGVRFIGTTIDLGGLEQEAKKIEDIPFVRLEAVF